MKKLLKQPLTVALLILLVAMLLPIILNKILLIHSPTQVVGNEETWLSFWGGYLGALISASVAFIILLVQRSDNIKQSNEDRSLQKQKVVYQTNCNNLVAIKTAFIDCFKAYSRNNLVVLRKEISENKKMSLKNELFDYASLARINFRTSVSFFPLGSKRLLSSFDELFHSYTAALSDLQEIAILYKKNIIDFKKASFRTSGMDQVVKSRIDQVQPYSYNSFVEEMLDYVVDNYSSEKMINFREEVFSFIEHEYEKINTSFLNTDESND